MNDLFTFYFQLVTRLAKAPDRPRRLSRRKLVNLGIALTILAWATQTMMSQAFGAEAFVSEGEAASETRPFGVARIELRSDATIAGDEIRLRHIARWVSKDAAVVDPIGDLIIARFDPGSPFKSISIEQLRHTLRDAGVNIATVNLVGATQCTVARTDAEIDEDEALRQWAAAKSGRDLIVDVTSDDRSAEPDHQTLGDLLVRDLAERLQLPLDSLQIDFHPRDTASIHLSQPQFEFAIEPGRVKRLGAVSWDVVIRGDGAPQRLKIRAQARAWMEQLVATQPFAARHVFSADDFEQRRRLVDELPDEKLLRADQVVGQQAARPIRAGVVLTADLIEAAEMVRPGQLVTLTLKRGGVQIRTVARALDGGSMGQTIRLKNENTKQRLRAVITGPQEATMEMGLPTG